jgi:hypothetical protein
VRGYTAGRPRPYTKSPGLVGTTAAHFTLKEVAAETAYLSHANLKRGQPS